MPINRSPESGFGLVELIVVMGMLSLVAILLAYFMKSSDSVSSNLKTNNDRLVLSRDIKRKIDCARLPQICPKGNLITIFARSGEIMIDANGNTKSQGWNVRAECTNENLFVVKTARIGTNGIGMKDPVDKKVLDWSHPKSVLFAERLLCAEGGLTAENDGNLDVREGESCYVVYKSELPCNPPPPPPCLAGFASSVVSLDSFGGSIGDNDLSNSTYGQRWLRYCKRQATR